ncbi:beta-ketoacyl-ACP synthase II [soil metagenome]
MTESDEDTLRMTPRAITGLGICSAIGIGREAFFEALRSPTLLRDRKPELIVSFDAAKYPGAALAEVPDFDATKYLGDKGLRTLDRLTKLLVVASRLALHDAGLKRDGVFVTSSADRVGVVCSNAYGSLEAITEMNRIAVLEDARYINPAKFPNTVANSASGYASIWEDLRALNVAISDGNCGALDAVACADIYLDNGRADALLVGCAESASEAIFLAFQRLGMIEAGTLLGAGAALLALEGVEFAKARGKESLATMLGCSARFFANDQSRQMTYASDTAMEAATRDALEQAGVTAASVDLVVTGCAGLRPFDVAEIGGVERVIGSGKAYAAPKRILGETLGAGGAMGMAAALAYLQGIPPTPLEQGAAPREVKTVLVTALGYYGNATCVVMRR